MAEHDSPASAAPRPKRLRPSGGYRSTASFQTATIIYDATYWFCEKFVDSRWRQFWGCTAYPLCQGTVPV